VGIVRNLARPGYWTLVPCSLRQAGALRGESSTGEGDAFTLSYENDRAPATPDMIEPSAGVSANARLAMSLESP
jgi:hypothetical protein